MWGEIVREGNGMSRRSVSAAVLALLVLAACLPMVRRGLKQWRVRHPAEGPRATWDKPAPYPRQQVYQQTKWSDLKEFTVAGSGIAVDDRKQIVLSGGAGSFDNYIALDASQNDDQRVVSEATLVVGTPPSGSYCSGRGENYGIGIGKQGTSSRTTNTLVGVFNTGNARTGTIRIQNPSGTGSRTVANSSCVTPGDIIRLVFAQEDNTVYFDYANLTKNLHARVQVTTPMLPGPPVYTLTNSSKFALYAMGGKFTLLKWRIYSLQPSSPLTAFVGDSKTAGYFAGDPGKRFSNLLTRYGPVVNLAGEGDTTTDVLNDLPYILAFRPKSVVLCIGYNDIGSGLPYAETQRQYTDTVSQLTAAGIKVIHLLLPSTYAVDMGPFNAWVAGQFTNVVVVPAVDLSADKIHPSAKGNAQIAEALRASGFLLQPGKLSKGAS
jgi:lysophospholipase L1-like esterase